MKTLGFLKGMVIGLMLTTGVVAVSAQDEKSGFFGVANRVGVGVGVVPRVSASTWLCLSQNMSRPVLVST